MPGRVRSRRQTRRCRRRGTTHRNRRPLRSGRSSLLDELGDMELDKRGAELLFQVLTELEEKTSVAIAANDSFGSGTKTFTGPILRDDCGPPHLRREGVCHSLRAACSSRGRSDREWPAVGWPPATLTGRRPAIRPGDRPGPPRRRWPPSATALRRRSRWRRARR
ncbi:ATP-binding protein [Nocardia sp. CA-290969]|uniref:ATP-binding protein n=1 Tax=Nocardia sp. CA-290969 TaxID=3239986 RepID=UPI003D915473